MSLAAKLHAGESVFGTMVRMVRNPAIASLVDHAGLDFMMLDLEHGAYSLGAVADIVYAARQVGVGVMARVPELSRGWVSGLLDSGANGIMVPMLETPEQARQLAQWAKYPPLGGRGLSSTGGHTGYSGPDSIPDFIAATNRETITIAQIETVAAVECIDEIAATPGIDALLIGPNDLSVSLGKPGDITCPEEDEAIRRVARVAAAAGKVFGMHAGLSFLQSYADAGLRLIMNSMDIKLLASGLSQLNEETRAAFDARQ